MSDIAAEFHFTEDRPQASPDALVVRIPAKLNRKRRLLAEIAGQLRFPSYFGWNWDAFEECLGDLSWLEEVQRVTILHRDVPFECSPEQRAIYLSVLNDRMRSTHSPRLTVVFPPRCRRAVGQSLQQSDSE